MSASALLEANVGSLWHQLGMRLPLSGVGGVQWGLYTRVLEGIKFIGIDGMDQSFGQFGPIGR